MSTSDGPRCPNPECKYPISLNQTTCINCGCALTPSPEPPAARVYQARPINIPAVSYAALPPPNALELSSISRRDAALDLGLVLLIIFFLPLAVGAFLAFSQAPTKEDLAHALSWPAKFLDAATVAGLAAYFILRHRIAPRSFGLRLDQPLRQVGWGAITLVSAYAYLLMTVIVVGAIAAMIPDIIEGAEKRIEFMEALPVGEPIFTAFLLIFVVIHEELLFRGLMLPYLRRITGHWWPAVLIASVLFGSLHLAQGVLGAMQIFGLSIVLSILFIRSRSLIAVMIAHFAFDFVQIQMIPVLIKIVQEAQQAAGH